jgi:hypothetical protein
MKSINNLTQKWFIWKSTKDMWHLAFFAGFVFMLIVAITCACFAVHYGHLYTKEAMETPIIQFHK